ncbi:MAG: pyridoxamine 5'-phosphate oxidase family protein [Candidatus Krumholzibacteriia bacterium]
MASGSSARTARNTVKRLKERGCYDRQVIHRILDEGIVCHLGFVVDGQPFVIPMGYARAGNKLLLHGSVASRLMRMLGAGCDACVTVTLLDGLVLARSALDQLVEHLVPGRTQDARRPTDEELAATAVLEIPLDEASAKLRVGPPKDDEEDLKLDVWAGVVPLRLTPLEPEAHPELRSGIEAPAYVRRYRRSGPGLLRSTGKPQP